MTSAAPGSAPRRHVLVGFAEAYAAIETAWSLLDAGFDVSAFARSGAHPALRHVRKVRVFEVHPPEDDAARTVADVRALIRALEPAAYLPLDDAAVWVRGSLEPHDVTAAGPSREASCYALDKEAQLAAARAAGLLVPPTRVVESLVTDDGAHDFPVIVKPARALAVRDGRLVRSKARVCADPMELARAAATLSDTPVLVQPLLRGVGEGLFGHATEQGVVGWSAHRRLRMLNPGGSASSACASRPVDPGLLEPAEAFLRSIGWRGLFMLEFLRDEQGRAWFMELNGRTWGSLALARRRGFEYPAWTVRSALEPAFRPTPPERPPQIVCRNLGLELMHLAFVVRGPRSAAQRDWPRLWPTLRQLVSVSRNHRLYNWRRSEPRVLAADTAETLAFYLRRAIGAVRT